MDSSRPGEDLLIALVDGDPRARAISEGWRPKLPVKFMSKEELDTIVETRRTTFNFPRQSDYYDRADEYQEE